MDGSSKLKSNQRHHAKVRFRQRLGIRLKSKLRKQIIAGIRKNIYEKVSNEGGSRDRYLVSKVGNKDFQVVYDNSTNELVTVLFCK